MNDRLFKHLLLTFVLLFVALCSFAQRDYWNDRRQYGTHRQQVVRNMKNWEQQERAERLNNQQRREVQQREKMLWENKSNRNNVSNKTASSNTENSNTVHENEKIVTLVTNGTGDTKEEATRNALRSAIEQAYGTFVSANTEVLNDELIKDEIVTVSTGNIKSYKELSVCQTNGVFDVSVQAAVSIDQLTKFAQSKGMQADFSGALFAMNMKMRQLNKENEAEAIKIMSQKAEAIARNGLFDYEIEIDEPFMSGSDYIIKVRILFCENDNTKAFYQTVFETVEALSLNNKELEEFKKMNIRYYCYNSELDFLGRQGGPYFLRNYYGQKGLRKGLMTILLDNMLDYEIKDSNGNVWHTKKVIIEDVAIDENHVKAKQIEERNILIWHYTDQRTVTTERGSRDVRDAYYYMLTPCNKIACVKGQYEKAESEKNYHGIISYVKLYAPIKGLCFNPIKNGKKSKYYYSQEFYLRYSESELSNLSFININHR